MEKNKPMFKSVEYSTAEKKDGVFLQKRLKLNSEKADERCYNI